MKKDLEKKIRNAIENVCSAIVTLEEISLSNTIKVSTEDSYASSYETGPVITDLLYFVKNRLIDVANSLEIE